MNVTKRKPFGVFDDNGPYFWERAFYKQNHIPMWTCCCHNTADLGQIWQNEKGSWIKAEVYCAPAQCWSFEIHNEKRGETVLVKFGSGDLQDYYPIAVKLATMQGLPNTDPKIKALRMQGMLNIEGKENR